MIERDGGRWAVGIGTRGGARVVAKTMMYVMGGEAAMMRHCVLWL